MAEGLVGRVRRKLSWPSEEETAWSLVLFRTEFEYVMGRTRYGLAELRRIAEKLPNPEGGVLPDDLATFELGGHIEVWVEDRSSQRSYNAQTSALKAAHDAVIYYADEVAEQLDILEREIGQIEEETNQQLNRLLEAAPGSLLETLEAHLDRMERPSFQYPVEPFKESAGLRQTLTAYLPAQVAWGLGIVTSYLYDQALEVGDAPGTESYTERELGALARDLHYLHARFRSLGDAIDHLSEGDEDGERIRRASRVACVLEPVLLLLAGEKTDETSG